MMRSLYSGISGLKNHQTRMDVIGNNIANVNTIGFKTSRVVFQDIYSQTLRTGSAGVTPAEDGTGGMGGTNPAQIGLGVKLGAIDVIHTSAPTQRTDNPLDLALDGDGYFIVQNPQTGTHYYTRAGNFRLDDKGNLVTTDGYFVTGYKVDPVYTQMVTKIQSINISKDPLLSGGEPVYLDVSAIAQKDMQALKSIVDLTRKAAAAPAVKSAAAAISKIVSDAAAAGKDVPTIIQEAKDEADKYATAVTTAETAVDDAQTDLDTKNTAVTTHKTGALKAAQDAVALAQTAVDNDATNDQTLIDALEARKKDLKAEEATLKSLEKIAENAATKLEQAETNLVIAEDAAAAAAEVAAAAENAGLDSNATVADITSAAADAATTVTADANKAVSDAATAKNAEKSVLAAVKAALEKSVLDGTYKGPAFDSTATPPVTVDTVAQMIVDGLKDGTFQTELGDVQTGNTPDRLGGLSPINLDGFVSIAVDFDGTIYGIKDDIRVPIAMLGVAMFANPSGLEKAGSSLYRKSGASGEPVETSPQVDGAGLINGGGLEMSNVDLATEFTDMIVTQRGYQANSRIITVSDSMLEELVNLKR